MSSKCKQILFLFFLLFTFPGYCLAAINPSLADKLSALNKDDKITVIVRLKEKPDLKQLSRRRAEVIKTLKHKKLKNQQLFSNFINQKKAVGKVSKTRNFWIFNGFALTATRTVIEEVAANPAVEEIHENYIFTLPPQEKGSDRVSANGVEWGISKIKADQVWSTYGLRGNGIRVGHLDTGVDATHPDLTGKIATWAEFDGDGDQVPGSTPYDSGTHGTHTAGTILGGLTSGNSIGVAPEATLVSALVLNGGSGTFTQVAAGMEWVIDPDGNPDTDDGAQVVNMSLGADGTYSSMIEPTDNMVAAGVFPAFSIGNSGQGYTGSPGNVPSAFGVGATDSSDQIAYFSGGGYVTWNSPPYVGTYLKPDISAPGVNVKSSVPGGGYDTYSGTSMAAPHVAGAVALLIQAKPTLTVAQMKQALIDSSVDYGSIGQDDRFGWGRMDILAAIENVTNNGTLEGTIKNSSDVVLEEAVVKITQTGAQTTSNSSGFYNLSLAPGTYTVEVSLYGYVMQTKSNVLINTGDTTTENFTLSAAPAGSIAGTVIDANTSAPLTATVEVLNTPVSPVTTNPVDGTFNITLSQGTYSLKVTSTGHSSQTRSNVIVGSGTTTENFSLAPNPPLLLVDDDAGSMYENYYKNSLEAIGRSYDYWNIASQGSPSSDTLNQYDYVIWYTGNNYSNTLTSTDQTNLIAYLNLGKNLFLTGQDVGWDISDTLFYTNYLHATYEQDDTALNNLNGVSGDIMDSINISITGGDGANNQYYPSEIDPVSPATSLFKYDISSTFNNSANNTFTKPDAIDKIIPTGIISSGTGGLKVDTGTYKLIYFSFGFEAINSASTRNQVLEIILSWLGYVTDTSAPQGTPGTPTDAGASSAVPNITFSWNQGTAFDPESGISGYYLQVSTSSSFTTTAYEEYVGNVFNKTITNGTNGLTYYAWVKAKNGAGLYTAYSGVSDGIIIELDTSAPSGKPAKPSAGASSTPNTTITFSWSVGTAADPESGITGYYLQVGTTPDGNDKYDSDVGNVLTQSISNCAPGSTYYARVKACNGVSLYSAYSDSSDGIDIIEPDVTPPVGPTTIRDGIGQDIDFTPNKNEISANWETAADPESGIAKYYYAIGTTPGGTDLINWTDNGTATSLSQTGLSLSDATTYYVSVKSVNGSGLVTDPVYSGYQETLVNNTFLGAGTAKNWKKDDFSWSYNLPFSFKFYGNNYTQFYVSSNGCLFFDLSGSTDHNNSQSSLKSKKIIAPLWNDLRTNGIAQTGEDIYLHQPDASSVCIRWCAETVAGSKPVNVEVILYSNGDIKFNYGTGNYPLTPTIGLSAGNNTDYLLSKFDSVTSLSQVQSARIVSEAKIYCSSNGQMVDSTAPVSSPSAAVTPSPFSGSTLNLSWSQGNCNDKESGIASYFLQVSADSNFATCIFNADVGQTFAKDISDCADGTIYYTRVKAKNYSGLYSIWSSTAAIVVDTTAPDGKSTAPTDTGAYSNINSLIFTWTQGTAADEQSGISGYYLQVSTSSTFNSFVFDQSVGSVLTKTIDECINGLTYYARVKALNGAGLDSGFSESSDGITIYAAIPQGTPGQPAAPKRYVSSREISFSWSTGTATDAIGLDSYYLQVSTETLFSSLIYHSDVGNNTSKTITECLENMTYYARVKVRNTAGSYGAWSEISGPVTIDTTEPTCTIAFSTSTVVVKSGACQVTLTINDAGAIEQTPTLTYIPSGQNPINASLTGSNENWTATIFVESTVADGPASFNCAIIDAAGNIGQTITAGQTFLIDKTIKAAEGGTISNQDGTEVFIPPYILPPDSNINVSIITPREDIGIFKEIIDKTKKDRGVKIITGDNTLRTFAATDDITGTAIHDLGGKVTISLPYQDIDQNGFVDNTDIDENILRVFYVDEDNQKMTLIKDVYLNPIRNIISCDVNHFSTFMLMGYVAGDLLGLDQTFCYPNPCYPGRGQQIKIVNLPVGVNTKLAIYNLAGELVRLLTEHDEIEIGAGSETATWDIKNEDGQTVASGIYIYVIQTDKSVKCGKKIAVLK